MINFNEISSTEGDPYGAERFELFARDFFHVLGFEILENPSRGSDGGMDLKVQQNRNIDGHKMATTWLVSCKHFAKSGKSVGVTNEPSILDRLTQHDCDGFIGFYSTIASNGLTTRLKGFQPHYPHIIYDHARIEAEIIGFKQFDNIFLRYFPSSYAKWMKVSYSPPTKLFNYYFNKEYVSRGSLLKYFFDSTEGLFKSVLHSSTLEEFLGNRAISLVVHDLINLVNAIGREHDEVLEKVRKQSYTKYHKMMYDNLLVAELEKIYGVKTEGTFKLISHSGKDGLCVLYPNILFANQSLLNQLEQEYYQLKDICS